MLPPESSPTTSAAVHESNCSALLCSMAWGCGSLTHPTHWLICAQADEFERLADADEELAARIRGAPQITVCAAPIACGKADGQLVHDRLARLAAGEALAGRPAPLVRCVLVRARITFHNGASVMST